MRDKPIYSIAVAAELAELAPATLRLYESKGLLSPARTDGGTRRYSDDDVEQLRRVAELQEDGVSLAGVRMVLDLQNENAALRREIAETAGDDEDSAIRARGEGATGE
jgi:DNA-binding transcriptional MerR regulator